MKPVAWFEQDPDMKSIWYQSEQDNPNAIPLYTHPVSPKYDPETGEPLIDGYPLFSGLPHPVKEHDLGISHAIGFDDGFKAGMQRAVEMNVVKELTDEEIYDVFEGCLFEGGFNKYEFARAILRKAQEK